MGSFHREITIDTGLKRLVKHRRPAKKKQGGRTVDEMTVITVRDMEMGPVAGGRLVIRSSNISPVPVLGAGWSKGARERIETRLRDSDGGRKGRVLYGLLDCLGATPLIACVLCYHVERAGEIAVKAVEVSTDLVDHRAGLFESLFRCAEHIACEHSRGDRAILEIDVEKGRAGWFRDTFGFREIRKSTQASRRILGRATPACRVRRKGRGGSASREAAA